MDMLFHVLFLLAGFVLLIKGADFFVSGSSDLAKVFKIPSLIVGLTIVAMGTSAPELAVSISAGIKGANEIAISNVIGSNLFNLLMVLGICSVIKPVAVKREICKKDFPFSILLAVVLALMISDRIFAGTFPGPIGEVGISETSGVISRGDAAILLLLLVFFMYITITNALKQRQDMAEAPGKRPVWLCLVLIAGGLAAIIFGGDIVVDQASYIARACGMSDTLVGLTIVAIGTSLPELVTSITASRMGENDIAVGNALGSNILNILVILGVSAMLNPIAATAASVIDLAILTIVSVYTYVMAIVQGKISRGVGISMVTIYFVYSVYIILR